MRTWTYAKGHGTLNDFVIIHDRQALLNPTADDVRFLCDRRRGVGGDGLLRVTKADRCPDWTGPRDLWFMDYRNADGSTAEMCGNGARVFVRYLLDEDLAGGDRVDIATRAGLVHARVGRDGSITVVLGRPRRDGEPAALQAAGRAWLADVVDVGNPHAVVWLDGTDDLDALDLCQAPALPADRYPAGGNVEFVRPIDPGHLRLRVWERGVGETRSCGTGVVAVAFDHLARQGLTSGTVAVTTPGGDLAVRLDEDGRAHLTGPAVIVARGQVTLPSC